MSEPESRRLSNLTPARIAPLLVVVQAVAGSSPVDHPHKVAAQRALLRERYNDSARAELPMSYQFFGGGGASWAL
jgi:hypothetical protein